MNKQFHFSHFTSKAVVFAFALFSALTNLVNAQVVNTITTTGSGTWTAPCGVTSITIECWGGGGGGASVTGNTCAGGGGSGGGYVKATYSVSAGTTYNYFVGSGGSAANNGTDSWFDNTSLIKAVGGNGAATVTTGSTWGTGATARSTGNVGGTTVNSYGGRGGNAGNNFSGGGGSSGGSSASDDASGMTGGTAPTDGFAGANGRNSNGNGADGGVGAGGSGGRTGNNTNRTGGSGGDGQIRITYTGGVTAQCAVNFSLDTEPITNVTFLGTNNTTSGTVNGTPDLQDFSGINCGLNTTPAGSSFSISVSGNTAGNYTNYIRVYADWNQNGSFADAGESYNIGTIVNCTNCSVSGTIDVPCSATLGNTALRVFKDYGGYPTNSCTSSNNYGQVEDYTVTVTASTGAYVSSTVTQTNTSNVLKGSTNEEVIGIQIVLSGCKEVSSFSLNTSGTTSTADITNARLWSTGTSSTFATTTQYGSTVAAPNGAFSFSESQFLNAGTYYYWLTYDVPAAATSGNVIDATVSSITVDAIARTPSITAPTGNRLIYTQKNWIGRGAGGTGTDFNTGTNWSPTGVPTAFDDAIMTITSDATVNLSGAATVGNLAVTVSGTNDNFVLNVGANTLTVNGTTNFGISVGNAGTTLHLPVGNGGTINFMGNASFTAVNGSVYPIYGTGGTTGVINAYGNVTFGNTGVITDAANLPGAFRMDGTGNQTLTCNSTTTVLPPTFIGNVNTPTVTLAGSVPTGLRPNNLTINGTLVLPTGFTMNRNAAGGTFTMNSGSLMRLQGTTGGQTGSNFPLSYSTMSLNNNSTVEYYSTSGQTIFAGTAYGHLTLTNNSTKSATAALTVNGNLTINSTATFAAGTSLTHNVGGNWTNNGTFSYTTANTINFNGNNALQTISGSSTTGFYNVTVNKGTANTNILDVTSLITLNNTTNPLTLTNGSFRLSSASTITPFSSTPTIPATAGLINNGGTINSANFSWTLNGLFRNIAGTTNIGNATGNSLTAQSGSTVDIQSGTVNIAGRLQGTGTTYSQSGGTVNINQIGNTSTTVANFDMNAAASMNMTGGTIVIRFPNTAGTPFSSVNILSGAGTKTITGGTFQFGDASTTASSIFLVNSAVSLYNVTINSTNSPVIRPVTNHLTVAGTLTMNGGNIDGATNTRDVIVTNNAAGAIVRTAGLINYNLKRAIGSSGATYLFPVGNGTNYNPANLTFTNLTAGDLNIRSVSGDEPNIANSGIDNTVSVNAYWAMTASNGLASTNYAGTVNYLAAQNDVAAQAANYITGIYSGSAWSYPTVSGTPTSTALSFTAASGFGNIAIGKCKTPPAAVAGSAQSVCSLTATLGATAVSLPARGTWTIVSGTGGSFANANNPTTTFSGTAGTTYTLRWSVGYPGSSCSVNTADVSITLNAPPTASAGGVISAFVGEYLTVSGATATNGSILWTHNGTGYFDQTYFPAGNETTTTPTYYTEAGDFGNTVNLTMTVTGSGACAATTATANYTINVDGRPALWTYQCGTTLADINDYIYAYAYPGATQYRFRINDGVTTQTFDTPASVFYFTQFPTYAYNKTYTVDVSVFVGGSWTAYGPTCSISTPNLPLGKVQASQCGTTLTSMSTPIYADLVEGATQYRFRVTDGSSTQVFDNPSRMFNMTQFSGYAYGTAYTIDVAVYYGFWQPYGSACVVTTPSLPTTQMMASHCGTTVANLDVDLYANEVPGATQYRFRATNGSSVTVDKPSRTFKFSQMAGILSGTAYTVDVAAYVNGAWGPYGSTCSISTPAAASPQLIASQCGATLTDIFTDLYCNQVTGATQYRFRVTNGMGTQTIIKPSRTFKLAQLSNVEYGTVNTVECDAYVSGAWIGYGTSCNVTTPAVGATKLITSQCGITIGSGSTALYADEVPGATQYRFRVVNGTDTSIVTKPSRVFTIIEASGITINTTYIVDVAVYFNGSWLTYGADCNITTPGSLIMLFTQEAQDSQTITGEDETIAGPQEVAGLEEQTTENTSIVAFPNPFEYDFRLDFVSQSDEKVNITVFDAAGKMIESITSEAGSLDDLRFGEAYQAGIYLVNLTQGNNSKNLKVIKR